MMSFKKLAIGAIALSIHLVATSSSARAADGWVIQRLVAPGDIIDGKTIVNVIPLVDLDEDGTAAFVAVVIGDNVQIGKDVVIGSGTTIGDGAQIDQGTVIGSNVSIGANAHVGQHASIGDSAVVSDGAIVPAYAVIPPGSTYP